MSVTTPILRFDADAAGDGDGDSDAIADGEAAAEGDAAGDGLGVEPLEQAAMTRASPAIRHGASRRLRMVPPPRHDRSVRIGLLPMDRCDRADQATLAPRAPLSRIVSTLPGGGNPTPCLAMRRPE